MEAKPATTADIENDERSIRELVETWLSACEKGDLQTMLNLLAEDVIFMVPNKQPFGKEVFAQNYQQRKGAGLRTESDIQEIKVLGDWAWTRNFLRVTFTDANGESSKHSGYVLTILNKRPDGSWVIAQDANLLTPE